MSKYSTKLPDFKSSHDGTDLTNCSPLTGNGIVCGFTWRVDDDCSLRVCGGQGITSDGTTICAPEQEYHFTHYQSINAPIYSLFHSEPESEILVWELLSGRPPGNNDARPLTPQNENEERQLFLEDKVILIYLDKSSLQEQEPDPEEDYDTSTESPQETQNFEISNTDSNVLRWLLIRQIDLVRYLGEEERLTQVMNRRHSDDDYVYSESYSDADDAIYEIDIYRTLDRRLDLPEISLRRLGYGCLNPFDCLPEDLNNGMAKLSNFDELYQQYVCIVDAATKELDRSIRQLQSWLVEQVYCHEPLEWTDWIDLLCAKWESFKSLNKIQDATRHRKEHVQYFYDWCRDLIMAYHELRKAVLCRNVDCGPVPNPFPCHLSLGVVMRPPLSWFPAALRHEYRQPPVYNGAAKTEKVIRHYHLRLLLLIQGFYLPDSLPDSSVNPYCDVEDDDELPAMNEIKVTPGRYYDQPLGEQSVPYYYPLTESRFSVHRFWDAFRSRSLTIDRHRSYHARKVDGSYSLLPQTTHPLRFNIDKDDFFRIEGHIGKELQGVEKRLNDLRIRWNLPFDVEAYLLEEIGEEVITVGTDPEISGKRFELLPELRGAEHLAGVRPYGTFVLLTEVREGKEVVIADFSLPYRCCKEEIVIPQVRKVTITGRFVDCTIDGEEPAPIFGVTVVDTQSPNTVIPVDQNIFAYDVEAEQVVNLEFRREGYNVISRQVTSEVETNLGNIELKSIFIELYGSVHYSFDSAVGINLLVTNPDGKVRGAITDFDGRYRLAGVHREATEITYSNSELSDSRAFDARYVCQRLNIDIDLNENLGNRRPRLDDLIIKNHGDLIDVRVDSNRYLEVADHYRKRFENHVATTYDELDKTTLVAENRATVEENVRALVEAKDLSLNETHTAYRRTLKALVSERTNADSNKITALDAMTKNVTLMYLDRAAMLKPEELTKGTKNALKAAAESSSLDLGALTTKVSITSKKVLSAKLADALKSFQN